MVSPQSLLVAGWGRVGFVSEPETRWMELRLGVAVCISVWVRSES